MVIFSLCFLLFINSMSIGLVFPIFAPLFTQSVEPLFSPETSLQTQTFFYTLILSIPTFFIMIGAPFWGKISDYLGRKSVLIIGLTGIAISFLLSSLSIAIGSLSLLFLSRILSGFMDGTEAVAMAAVVEVSPLGDKTRNLAVATFSGTIGFIVGPIIGGFLAEPSLTGRFHFVAPFLLSFLVTLINVGLLYCFFPKLKSPQNNLSHANYLSMLLRGFMMCLDKRIRGYSFLLFVIQCTLAIFFQLSTLLLVEKFNYSSGKTGLFTTFLGACFSAGIFFVIHVLLKRISALLLLRLGLYCMGLSVVLAFYFQNSPLFAWISVVPLMLGIAMMYNVLLTMVSNAVSAEEQGEAMGSGTALKSLGWLCAAFVISSLYPNIKIILIFMMLLIISAWWISISNHLLFRKKS